MGQVKSSNAWSIKWGLRGMLVSDGVKAHLINCEAICVHEEGARIQQSWIRGFRMSTLHKTNNRQINRIFSDKSTLLLYRKIEYFSIKKILKFMIIAAAFYKKRPYFFSSTAAINIKQV